MSDGATAAVAQLRAWMAQGEVQTDGRLPPEREPCALLWLSRAELRKALQVLAAEASGNTVLTAMFDNLNAIRGRDVAAARRAMLAHLDSVNRQLQDHPEALVAPGLLDI